MSVVIPSHARPDLLALCLASVKRFAPPGTEIIVVDDGSPHGCISQRAAAVDGVKVVRRSRAGGFCAAANAGIAVASAPVVELLNDDSEVTPGWAEAALAWFADRRIAAVAPLVLQNDPIRRQRGLPPRIDTAGDDYDFGGFARKRGHGLLWPLSACPTVDCPPQPESWRHAPFPAPEFVFGASACAAFYRRDALLAAGGFPEHFGAYFEDIDLSFRLQRLGGRIVYEPRSVVWHRLSSSYGRKPGRRTLERQSCNEERVFWRNVRGRLRWKYLPRHAAVLAGKAMRRFQEGTFLPWLMGRLRAVAG